jgi:sugar/nucleoside kinase (ribokinase family)
LLDVVSVGEPLVQMNPIEEGPLRHVPLFEKHAAGSESNVVIGLSRLGFKTAYVSKVGKDELSKFLITTLRGEGVDVSHVEEVRDRNCGVFFVQRGYPVPGKSDVIYFRKDSAASTLGPDDIDPNLIKQSKMVHVSGITPALSQSCKDAVSKFLDVATRSRIPISFDTNYRSKLWSEDDARRVLSKMAAKADILFTDPSDARLLLLQENVEAMTPEKLLDELAGRGPKTVVLKLGPDEGLFAVSGGRKARTVSPSVPVVDSIGAGDAVVVGFLSGLLRNEPLEKCLDLAACCSALVVMRRGDFENLPDQEYFEKWLRAKKSDFRVDYR